MLKENIKKVNPLESLNKDGFSRISNRVNIFKAPIFKMACVKAVLTWKVY